MRVRSISKDKKNRLPTLSIFFFEGKLTSNSKLTGVFQIDDFVVANKKTVTNDMTSRPILVYTTE